MPKHKPKRGAPSIDMTAMCDVAFLLLTFFMLTAKAKPQELVPVDTPTSVSETKLPDVNTLTILVSKEGYPYLDMAGQHTRLHLIKGVNERFQLGLSEEDALRFANVGSFGIPRAQLKAWLRLDPSKRGQVKTEGIPIDTANVNSSELADWIHNARLSQSIMKQEKKVEKDYAIVVKADKDTPYPAIRRVINTLTDIKCHKFNLITSLEGSGKKE
jgi:biopolymer transport protein ExbD